MFCKHKANIPIPHHRLYIVREQPPFISHSILLAAQALAVIADDYISHFAIVLLLAILLPFCIL